MTLAIRFLPIAVPIAALTAGCTDKSHSDTDTGPETDTATTGADLVLLDTTGEHYGRTISDWSVSWWQWVYQMPGPDHPLFDDTGESCDLEQSGDVWFLVGTVGGSASRSCTIPADRALLFPIVNVSSDDSFATGTASLRTEQELIDAAAATIDSVSGMFLEIDDQSWTHDDLLAYRAGPAVFSYTVPPEPNFYTLCCSASITGTVDPSVSDGYWAMLDPLPAGPHTIHFGGGSNYGGNPAYGSTFDVTYELTVQ